MRLGRGLACVLGTALALLGATGASALAANRFASPAGSGTLCTFAGPCDIVTAVNSAGVGDDVTIEPGTYGPLSTDLTDAATISIHGQAGQPRPVIDTTANQGFFLGHGSTLSDVDVEDSSTSFRPVGIDIISTAATVDHVVSHASGSNSPVGCLVIGSLSDSVCWASGSGGFGAWVQTSGPATQSATLRNDTLIGSAPGGDGVVVSASGGFTATLDLINSIARGVANDVLVQAGPTLASTANFIADHSNYANADNAGGGGTISMTPAGSGTNQTSAPAFANAAAGDFHELASSPTVDAGIDSTLNGTTDLAGNPRQVGIRTDIGAYEFISPPFCSNLSASTAFGVAKMIQLQCGDIISTPLTYAITSNPAHGAAVLDAGTGAVTYTPAAGYAGQDSFSYSASNSHGVAETSTVSITVGAGQPPPPQLSSVKYGHRTFTFSLTQAARVTLTFTQLRSGRSVHHKCVAPTRKNRRHHSCVRPIGRGSMGVAVGAGNDSIHFTGRLPNGRTLPRGKYQVRMTASDATGTSQTVTVDLTI